MKVVAFLPIKLNSQRLPKKNILPIAGKPLCWHMSECLSKVSAIDEVFVYCSDPTVKNYVSEKSVFLKRDPYLDQDQIKGKDIYDAFVQEVDADIYVLVHTTSPFTKATTVEAALNKVLSGQYDSAFSAQRIQTFAWYQDTPINYHLEDVPRTQDLKPIYVETSAFYIFRKEIWTQHRRRIGFHPYIQEVDSMEAVDIDTEEDYKFALLLVQNWEAGAES